MPTKKRRGGKPKVEDGKEGGRNGCTTSLPDFKL